MFTSRSHSDLVFHDLNHAALPRDRRKIFPLLLLRMTNNSRDGGLAKVVRRRLQVLHLTPDGTTALLGIDIEQEDMRALEVDDHQREILRRGDQVFQLQMLPGSKASTAAQTSIPRSGASFTNFENIVQAMAQFAPRLYMVLGPDKDGILRHMGLSRIWTGSTVYTGLESTPVHVPLYNIRIGDFKISENDVAAGGSQDFVTKDIAWMGWFIPGDDKISKKFPFESDVTNCCSFLCCFFKQWFAWPALTLPGIHKISREVPLFVSSVTKLLLSLTWSVPGHCRVRRGCPWGTSIQRRMG
jgi:hypothetical protein